MQGFAHHNAELRPPHPYIYIRLKLIYALNHADTGGPLTNTGQLQEQLRKDWFSKKQLHGSIYVWVRAATKTFMGFHAFASNQTAMMHACSCPA